jgi:hypothetical protein
VGVIAGLFVAGFMAMHNKRQLFALGAKKRADKIRVRRQIRDALQQRLGYQRRADVMEVGRHSTRMYDKLMGKV